MTLKEFLVHLSNVTHREKVRKYLLTGVGPTCPITTVAKSLTNANYGLAEWDIAAKKIDLNVKTARKIIDASDDACLHDEKLRNKLLLAVGLPIETDQEDE